MAFDQPRRGDLSALVLALPQTRGKVTIFYSKSSAQQRNFSTPASPNFSKLAMV